MACSVSFRQAYCWAMDAYFLLLFYIRHFMEHLEKYSLVDSPAKHNGLMRSGLGVGKSRGHAARRIAPARRQPSITAAPRGDQRICGSLFMRVLTGTLTVDSARDLEIGRPFQ
jgi:hypothetical protein